MPVKDIRSQLIVQQGASVAVSGNGTTDGEIIDTANYELGIMFVMLLSNLTDGTYDLIIRESDDSGMAGSTVVPTEKYVNQETIAGQVSPPPPGGAPYPSAGVFSTKRYLRPVVQAAGVTTGAQVDVHVIQASEYQPVTEFG